MTIALVIGFIATGLTGAGKAGGRTDLVDSGSTVKAAPQGASPSADPLGPWHAAWVVEHKHRLKTKWLLGKREQRIVRLLVELRRMGAGRSSGGATSSSQRPDGSWSTSTATWYGPGFYGHSNACGTGTLSESSWWVATVPRQCGRWFTICTSRCVRVQSQDTGGFTPGNFDLTPAVARALGGLHTMTVRYR